MKCYAIKVRDHLVNVGGGCVAYDAIAEELLDEHILVVEEKHD